MNKKINEFTEASATANFSNAVSFDSDIAHKLDKNWTVGMTQRVDMGRKGKAQLPYTMSDSDSSTSSECI